MLDKKDPIDFIKGDFETKYEIIDTLKEITSFSVIYLVKSKISGEIRCLKRIQKTNIGKIDDLKKDLLLLSQIDNQNLVNIIEIFINFSNFDIITEYCQGGSLANRLNLLMKNNDCFTNEQAAFILKQIILALKYTHKNKIIHGEINLDNILFTDKNPENLQLKLVDFGISKNLKKEYVILKNKLKMNYFNSPEHLNGEYSEYSDVWSCGVLLYIILIGTPPFFSDVEGDDKMINYKILNYDFHFNNKNGVLISESAKDLISQMICKKEKRLNCREVLNHPFLAKSNSSNEVIQENTKNYFIGKLKEYQKKIFGSEGLYFLKKKELIKPVQDLVFEASERVAKSNRLAIVFDKSGEMVMIYTDPIHDYTDFVLEELGLLSNEATSN